MTNEELGKKLRLAGFPYRYPETFDYVPDFRELIEIVGDDILSIFQTKDGRWNVYTNDGGGKRSIQTLSSAKTVEHALAFLWLKLNEKENTS